MELKGNSVCGLMPDTIAAGNLIIYDLMPKLEV